MAPTSYFHLSKNGLWAASLAFSLCLGFLPSQARPAPTPAPNTAAKRSWVYSLSQKQEVSNALMVWGVPACAAVNGGNPRGIYITGLTGYGLADELKLQVGDVLLSINGRVITSAKEADRIIYGIKSGEFKAVAARQENGRVYVFQPRANFFPKEPPGLAKTSTAEPETAPANESQNVDVTRNSQSNGHGMYSSSYNALESKKSAVSSQSMAGLESYMLELINSDRQKNGQGKLRLSTSLSQVARKFAEDMAARNFFDHTDPDGNSPHSRARMAGLNCSVFENISVNYGPLSWKDMIKGAQAEMMSEPANNPHNHRGNILNPDHAVVGVGMAVVMPNKIYCVQEFSNNEVP